MSRSPIETYPQLWHYTTGIGLHGILTSQQLWATGIAYLKDEEEFTGFFDRKLLPLLTTAVQEVLSEIGKTDQGQKLAEDLHRKGRSEEDIPREVWSAIREVTLRVPTYVTSFCIPSSADGDDGLLSQWRAYGLDGGYAIAFDTRGLHELLTYEHRNFALQYSCFGDVDYHDADTEGASKHEEAIVWEDAIKATIKKHIVQDRDPEAGAFDFWEPIVSLATRHKHRGFREEREVRIVVTLPDDEGLRTARVATGGRYQQKDVHFTLRGGTLVPHIKLFERPPEEQVRLPIRKVIVGPHADKAKRQKAVELMLDGAGIRAPVVASGIPYLGG